MITTHGGESQAVAFSEVVDAATGGGRRRAVAVDTESYQVARDYMVRIGRKDFADELWVAKLAEAAGLSPADFVERFGHLSR